MKTVREICLTLILTTAVAIGCAIAVIGTYSVWEDYRSQRGRRDPDARRWESVEVGEDGQVMIKVSSSSGRRTGGQFFDTQRNPIPNPSSLLDPVQLPVYEWLPKFNRYGFKIRVLSGLHDEHDSFEAWHFIYEDKPHGLGRFELYDTRTRRLIGSLGTKGFRAGPLDQSEMFVVDGLRMANEFGSNILAWYSFDYNVRDYDEPHILIEGRHPISRDQLILPAEDSLFLVDLNQRSVKQLLPDDAILSAAIASRLEPLPDDFQPRGPEEEDDTLVLRQFVAVRTQNGVVLLNPLEGTQIDFKIPDELTGQQLDIYLTSDGGAVLTSFTAEDVRRVELSTTIIDMDVWRVAPDGDVINRETVTLHRDFGSFRVDSVLALAVPSPLVGLSFTGVLLPWLNHLWGNEPFGETARKLLGSTWAMHLLVALLAAGLAYAAHRHRVNDRLPQSYGWLAFVFLFGLPGFVGYLLHRRWPVRHPVPPPQPTGAEVFA